MADDLALKFLATVFGVSILGGIIGGAIAYFSGWGWMAVWLYVRGGAEAAVVLLFFVGIVWLIIANRKS